MTSEDRENGYLRTPAEVADALGLPLLGALAAEARFHQLAEGLASLSPDPRFSGRLYRFIDAETPLIWVAGLGDAGEELPVAIGLAEMAAATGAAPVLLAFTREGTPPGDAPRHRGRPIFSHRFADAVAGLFPAGCVAGSSGIQGVYRAWPVGVPEDAPLEPAAMVVAGPALEGSPNLPASDVTHVILVVPYRDQPRRRLVEAADAVRAAGYAITGCVAFGHEPGGATPRETVLSGPDQSSDEEPAAVPAFAPSEPFASEAEPVPVRQSWSATFGPNGGRSTSSPWRRGLVLAAVVVGAALVAFAGVTLLRMRSTSGPARAAVRPTVTVPTPELPPEAGETAAADSSRATPVTETAPREPEPPASENPAPPPKVAPEETLHDIVNSRAAPFAVQCGAFRNATVARREAQRLSGFGMPARALRVRIPGQGEWWRVVMGEFAEPDSALALARRLIAQRRVTHAHPVGAAGLGRSLDLPAVR